MAYPIEEKLVVGITSTALFDLAKEHEIFVNEGLEAFRKYQAEHVWSEGGEGFHCNHP